MASASTAPHADLVTPEAVPIELPAAGIGSRALALAVDLVVIVGLLLVVALPLALLAATVAVPDWLAVTVLLVTVAALLWGYPTGFETLARGRTPGKMLLGLRVVTREGGPVRLRHAALRAALVLVEIGATTGGLAVLSALVTSPPRRLGDLAAGTFVINERVPRPTSAVTFTVPAGWEQAAARLDPGALDAPGYAAVRTALLRAGELPSARATPLLEGVAAPLARRLGLSPPTGAPAQAFLVCLAARYQQRADAAGRGLDADSRGVRSGTAAPLPRSHRAAPAAPSATPSGSPAPD